MVPHYVNCSCNPANGGSGLCGCTIANKLVPAKSARSKPLRRDGVLYFNA